jgi:hypothetical protein
MKTQKAITIIVLVIAISISFIYNIEASTGDNIIMENEFINRIKNLEKQINEIGRNRQVYQSDWFSLNTSEIIPLSTNVFSTTRDLRNIISVGTKIRILGASSYSYFYVTYITATTININAGDDFVFFTTSPYNSFEYSNASSPVGHPLAFNYTPASVRDRITLLPISINDSAFKYSMQGGIMTIFFDIRNTVGLSASTTIISFSLPDNARPETPVTSLFPQLCRTVFTGGTVGLAIFEKGLSSISVSAEGTASAFTLFVFAGVYSLVF